MWRALLIAERDLKPSRAHKNWKRKERDATLSLPGAEGDINCIQAPTALFASSYCWKITLNYSEPDDLVKAHMF